EQDPGRHEKSAGESGPLALSSGERVAALADRSVVAVRQVLEVPREPGHPARLLDLAARRGGAAERDVVRERHGEEEGFLRYDRDRAPQPRLLDPGEVDSPELDRSVGDRIEPREEPDEGGLPRA